MLHSKMHEDCARPLIFINCELYSDRRGSSGKEPLQPTGAWNNNTRQGRGGMSTTLDLFEAAIVSLTRPTPIKDRLTDAYRNHLAFVDERDLPADVCEEFRGLMYSLTRQPPMIRDEDSLRATVRKMSNHEAADAASAVVRIFSAVSRADAARAAPQSGEDNV